MRSPGPDGRTPHNPTGHAMNIGFILLIVLILALVGAFPAWPHSLNWGYYPSSGIGLILVVVLVLVVLGRI